jgi:hypothetical protein
MYELPDIRWIIDRAAVVDTIVASANAIDAQDWQKLRSHLADEIDIDYSEFRGETPRRVTAEEYLTLSGLKPLRFLIHRIDLPVQNYFNISSGQFSTSVMGVTPSSGMPYRTQSPTQDIPSCIPISIEYASALTNVRSR